MSEQLYLRLIRELDASRFDSEQAATVLAQLGAPAYTLRGLARARRHGWLRAGQDFSAALDQPGVAALIELICGVGLFACRRYDDALRALGRAAAHGKPGVATKARKLGQEFAQSLGWFEEARALGSGLGARAGAGSKSTVDGQQIEDAPWEILRSQGPRAAGAVVDALLDREQPRFVPALILTRIRLDLLLGDGDRARDRAEARLAALSTTELEQLPVARALLARLRGDAKAVVVRTTHHHGDPELLYLRAWALSALGSGSEATELLERARRQVPGSIRLQLALALAHHELDPEALDEGLDRRFEALVDWAPGLLSDAARLADAPLWTETGLITDRAAKLRIIRKAQSLLSEDGDLLELSYRLPSAAGSRARAPLRHLLSIQGGGQGGGRGGNHLASLHGGDRARIQELEAVLIRALGVHPPPPEQIHVEEREQAERAEAWSPRSLSPAQIEGFIEDGFLLMEGAFDPALAERWREDAIRRIREQPQQWVRGYDPNDPATSLRDFDPQDPATWTWPRIELQGPETVSIAEFSPRGWAAICDLLGGPGRVQTKTWRNYLIMNLCADAHLDVAMPGPEWISWHIDDPSPMTRIDRIRNGLVGIALFDDLLPRSGNTWLAPDSVARVARELAAHPEGVDFCTQRGSRITTQCQRFHEVVGKAGDLLLMHPLMMHSSSPNPSGRIRWMGNPMVYLNQPLQPFRPRAERSPVEEAIARAADSQPE